MSKKKEKDNHAGASKYTTKDYYSLKTDAVDRLVNAEKKAQENNTGSRKKDPGKEYRSKGFLNSIPNWIKALFIKFWFNGAVCYFIFWGLGLYVQNMLDMIVVLAIVLGMVTDILVNNAFRFLEKYKGQNNQWMMFPQKKYWTFFANMAYSLVVLLGVIWFYNVINVLANSMNGTEGQMYIGVEPILFGLSYMLIDMCFIGMKNTLLKIISDAKQKNEQ